MNLIHVLLLILTGMTLISDIPLPVSDKSRSVSGSTSRASVLFFNIDLDLLCASLEPSIKMIKFVIYPWNLLQNSPFVIF